MDVRRNQVWKFDGRLWRVEAVSEGTVELVELLGDHTMTALALWLLASPEWTLVYTHD